MLPFKYYCFSMNLAIQAEIGFLECATTLKNMSLHEICYVICMKGMFRLTFALILFSTILSLWGLGLPKLQTAYASPHTDIDVETAYNMITNGSYPELVALDVRNQSEYDTGHIYGAVWIPVWQLETRIDELANHKHDDIIVYCLGGGRSATASGILDDNNFTKVYNMLGGITAWKYAGYPVWNATVHNIDTTFNYDTIQAAIDTPQTLAGHTILVDQGIYYEHVAVNKSLSLIGENKSTTIIDGNETGTVIEITADNVKVAGFTVRNSFRDNPYFGVYVADLTAGTNISYNIIMNNGGGVCLMSSSNIVFRNNITQNLRGVMLGYSSNNNTVSENNIAINDFGVLVNFSYNNTLFRNQIVNNNYDGIQLTNSSDNTFCRNEIKGNNHYGIRLNSSYNNTLYHNNFDNTQQLYINPSVANFWDDGFEGNYWSDYIGVDSNHDGIGDSNYTIDANNNDRYPLMGMFHSFNTSLGYTVDIVSNSTIEDFWYYDYNKTIVMHVSNMTTNQIFGFCRLRIPYALINETFQVTINGAKPDYWNYTLFDDGNSRWIYFSYEHSTLEIIILPELQSFLLLLPLMIATLLAAIIYKRKPIRNN
jgi:parallel beta-helix repeat protein